MVPVLLYFATVYLIFTGLILLRNRKHLCGLAQLDTSVQSFGNNAPVVSICIPARNEETNIRACVESALLQSYPKLEVLVMDDHSTDDTRSVLRNIQDQYNNHFIILEGKPKPAGWLGKSWACHQLAKSASGDILIFIDADTKLENNTVARTVKTMGRDVLGFLTIWPRQKLVTFWEKMVIPLVYHTLLSTLPVKYVFKNPRWIPTVLAGKLRPFFAAACGQFMAFKRSCYEHIGGHETVKNQIVEDVALARIVVKAGYRMRMFHGLDSITCRMYEGNREMQAGFRKNFLAGFNFNIPLFSVAAILHFIVFVLPFIIFPFAIYSGSLEIVLLSSTAIFLILIHRFFLANWFEWNPIYGILHPVSVLWFQLLGVNVLKDYLKGRKPVWKDRELD